MAFSVISCGSYFLKAKGKVNLRLALSTYNQGLRETLCLVGGLNLISPYNQLGILLDILSFGHVLL